ncbi:MAG: aromatic ring-hydroxylating dioxygenase subunit alpha, partial [Candidatus Eremiobacteraeota bacterium]|nr:aromatic ring-hydroxylating dioxygenase subunit alpha [Candidatus Eremiobacteraeota bacterium]
MPLERSLPRDAYLEPAFFAKEQEGVFWREWFAVGREEQFAQFGSYRVVDVAGESIILVRSRDGGLRGFLNLCRHRGSRLLRGTGMVREAIRCPYHGWTYALDGSLKATPFIEACDIPDEIDGLHRIDVDRWGGFVFARVVSGDVPRARRSLPEQLGAATERVARYPLAALRIGQTLTYDVAANWKVILENYNECYH